MQVVSLTAGFAEGKRRRILLIESHRTAPLQPANIQQCAEESPDLIICRPGLDPDGVGEESFDFDPAGPIIIQVSNGAYVTGNNGFADGATASFDVGGRINNSGSIVGDGNEAISANSDSLHAAKQRFRMGETRAIR